MVCASCGRRVDPTRSFCTNCGSSVFVEDRGPSVIHRAPPRLPSLPSVPPQASKAASAALRSLQRSASSFDRAAVRAAARSTVSVRTAPFRLGPLIKLAIFVFVIWTAFNWLMDIPEMIALKEGFQHGRLTDDEIRAAGDAVRARIDALLGRAPASTPSTR